MQIVYIDTLLCVNMFIDYIMLYLMRKLMRINSKAIRLLPASVLGSFLTLGVFLPFYTTIFSIFYRILSAAVIVFTAFGKTNFKGFVLRTLAFIGTSISFSGTIILIWLIFKPSGVVIYNDIVYFDLSPLMLIVCTLIAFISISIFERFKSKRNPKITVHKVTVYTDNSQYSFSSMVDTGCSLKEPFSGLPVIIAEREIINEADIPKSHMRVVPYSTLSGEGALYAYKPKKIEIDGKELRNGCYIALSDNRLNSEIKSLMGAEITEGL